MKKIIISTDKAPAPIGPYSQAIKVNNLLYTSGQIAIIPSIDKIENSNIEAETKQVMENLKAILEAGGATFDSVIKTSIFVSDMENFAKINKVYSSYFDDATAPARETVEVANLPKYVNVEISAIAITK